MSKGPTDVLIKTEAGLIGTFTEISRSIHHWCADNEIDADFITKWWDQESKHDFSLWRINNDEHRTMFILKWANQIHMR